ncbi:beta-ketoacyl-ACP synthase III [Olsenella sp. Marseille-P4559]|uniref:beta-ketoacyl-ACP synthase III n=1 Tax=Olsenella sp. Marseille-P4559 TaxID=2364795 RepID=UPI0010312F5D|nr:beta-ketoacyl-ACP synthase III [Olsenella sp. Marseille-P4559]
MPYTIIGTGSALPECVVTNDELSQFLDTSDEWIRVRTGIRERRICTTESLDDLAEQASLRALASAGIDAADLDLIVCSTTTGDHLMPAEACAVAERLGASCPAFDVSAACSGFVFALDVADGYLARGRARRALVLSAEKCSRIMDWTDRSTCVLFGDAAAAVVVESGGASPLWTRLRTIPNVAALDVSGIVGTSPFDRTHDAAGPSALSMRGRSVYRFAVTEVSRELRDMAGETGVALSGIDHFVLHQANERIIDAVCARLGLDRSRVAVNMATTGNVSSACIPLALDGMSRRGELAPGELVALVGFGAGLDVASTLVRWEASPS